MIGASCTTSRLILRQVGRRNVAPALKSCRRLNHNAVSLVQSNTNQTRYLPDLFKRSTDKTKNTLKRLKKKTKWDTTDKTSREGILMYEIQEALSIFDRSLNLSLIRNPDDLIERYLFNNTRPETLVMDVTCMYQTSEGDCLAIIPKVSYVTKDIDRTDIANRFTVLKIPKALEGEKVNIRILRHHHYYAEAALLLVSKRSRTFPVRNDSLILCEKFDKCSGCQYQMISYDDQLALKKKTIEKAYKMMFPSWAEYIEDKENFGNVVGSPLQYAYRTKITPHYLKKRQMNKLSLNIGFNNVLGNEGVVDLQSCPIATPSINKELSAKRQDIMKTLDCNSQDIVDFRESRKLQDVTLLLRDSLDVDHSTGEYRNVCVTNGKHVVTQQIDGCVFQFQASEFFQNNNSILPLVLEYIRYQIKHCNGNLKHLVDTYCGSGFFGICLSKDMPDNGKVFGIEVSKLSIKYANHNAKLNGLSIPKDIEFIEGTASNIFSNKSFLDSNVEGNDTIVIMDPSRKGSNASFIQQLIEFRPRMIIYVSCNVFTQARDLAHFFETSKHYGLHYRLKEVTGFDFFAQTKHVESIAVLELR